MKAQHVTVGQLERFHRGDAAALETIVAGNRAWLWAYVRRRMGNHLRLFEASEDVVQDVLRELIARGPAFVPETDAQFRRLVGAMALNRLRDLNDYARAGVRDRANEASDGGISRIGCGHAGSNEPQARAIRAEQASLVGTALELMDSDDAYVLRRREWDGATHGEIGDDLGISEDAAQKRHTRAMARLGDLMRRLEDGDLSWLPDPLEPDPR